MTYYDGEGRAVAQVDADGYLTTTAHDETTHITTTARYGTALTSAQLAALTGSESVTALVGLLGGNTANQQSSMTYNADGQVATATAVDGTVTTNSYNLVGQLLSTTVTPTAGQGAARTINATYDAFGDTLTDTSYYDAFGRRLAISQTSQANNGAAQNTTRVFADDAAGEIVQRRNGTVSSSTFTPYGGSTSHHYTYVNGQQVSDMDEGGDINVANTLTAFSSGGGSAGSYVVQGGDTLESIAQAVYGNSQYSYIVAEANGLAGDGDLVPGQSITIPSVTTNSNTANTFKPYDPNSITGSTTPSLPAAPPPPPSQAGCNTLAMIVIIAVVVVASIFTAGVAAEAFAGTLGTAAGGGAAGIMAAGGAAMVGAGGLAGVEAAAIGGFAGSTAGQLTGDALGVSHGFSFGQALTAGLAAGFTAGVGGEISAGGGGYSMLADSSGSLHPAGAALFGAGAYAGGVVAAKVTGEATHFSWAGLAASAIASGVTAGAGLKGGPLQKVGQTAGSFTGDVAGGLLSGALNRETSQLLGDNRVGSWASIGEDVFGNALGNAAVTGIEAYDARSNQQRLDKIAASENTLLASEQARLDADMNGQAHAQINEDMGGGNFLPDSFIGMGGAQPTLDDLRARLNDLQVRQSAGTVSGQEFDREYAAINQAFTGLMDSPAGGVGGISGSGLGVGSQGRPLGGYENGVLNINIYDTPDPVQASPAGVAVESNGYFSGISYATVRDAVGHALLPSIEAFGERGVPGTWGSGLWGAGKQLWNTALGTYALMNGDTLVSAITGTPTLESYSQAHIADNELGGAAIVEGALFVLPAAGKVGGLGRLGEAGDALRVPDTTALEFSGGTPALEGTPFSPEAVNARSAEFYSLYGDNPLRGSMSNLEARQWYLAQDASIPESLDPYASLEDQARQAFDLRNTNRTDAREFMSDRVSADRLIREEPNRTWEQMINYRRASGLSDEQIYQSIIESSQRTRVSINKQLGLD